MSPSKARAVARKAPREGLGIRAAIRKASRLLPLLTPPRTRSDRCTRLTRSSREDRLKDGARAGLLALGSSYSPRLPGPEPSRPVAPTWVSSPITVTGSRRIRTAFPWARTRRAARTSVKPDLNRPDDRGQPPARIPLGLARGA